MVKLKNEIQEQRDAYTMAMQGNKDFFRKP